MKKNYRKSLKNLKIINKNSNMKKNNRKYLKNHKILNKNNKIKFKIKI